MAKYYFKEEDGEQCYPLKRIKSDMESDDIKELEVFEAGINYGSGDYYCVEFGEVGLSEEANCGKECKFYDPRNGKSGRCKHSKNTYSPIKLVTIKL